MSISKILSLGPVMPVIVIEQANHAIPLGEALLTGGIKTSVPPFISTEDFVVISTADSSYIEKAKK